MLVYKTEGFHLGDANHNRVTASSRSIDIKELFRARRCKAKTLQAHETLHVTGANCCCCAATGCCRCLWWCWKPMRITSFVCNSCIGRARDRFFFVPSRLRFFQRRTGSGAKWISGNWSHVETVSRDDDRLVRCSRALFSSKATCEGIRQLKWCRWIESVGYFKN